jgi:hypothetical protein
MNEEKEMPDNLEEIIEAINKNELTQEQIVNLFGVYYLYNNTNINPGSSHEVKYGEYGLSYFLNEVKKNKTPLEIMDKILDECELYSRQQICNNHFKGSTN